MKNNISAIVIAIALIATAVILSNAYKYRFRSAEEISVVGLAEVDFTSDLIVWQGKFERKSFTLKEAYSTLKADEQLIKTYLKNKGISDSSVIMSAVNIDKEFDQSFDDKGNVSSTFSGYRLSQQVRLQSTDMNRVEAISREVTELIEQGIEFKSEEPLYFYTKLSTLKMDLLAKASEDAKLRAETIAKSVSSDLGKLKKASMGVFQITGKNSNEDYSYGGAFNTRDKFKTASITIRMDYRLR